jgi:hypothetical protein
MKGRTWGDWVLPGTPPPKRGRRLPKFAHIWREEMQGFLERRKAQVPANGHFLTRYGVIEVAANLRLRLGIVDGLRRHGALTSRELASFAYWGRCPYRSRLGAQWQANASMRSATRRALADLTRRGRVESVGWCGREKLYGYKQSN